MRIGNSTNAKEKIIFNTKKFLKLSLLFFILWESSIAISQEYVNDQNVIGKVSLDKSVYDHAIRGGAGWKSNLLFDSYIGILLGPFQEIDRNQVAHTGVEYSVFIERAIYENLNYLYKIGLEYGYKDYGLVRQHNASHNFNSIVQSLYFGSRGSTVKLGISLRIKNNQLSNSEVTYFGRRIESREITPAVVVDISN